MPGDGAHPSRSFDSVRASFYSAEGGDPPCLAALAFLSGRPRTRAEGPSFKGVSVPPHPPAHNDVRLAILAQGGRNWIAGIVYLENLVRALALLPALQRPDVRMIFGPGQDDDAFRELGQLLPPVHHYAFLERQALSTRLRTIWRHRELHRWPTSLERLVRQARVTAIFPVRRPLGQDFPCPWLAWIPDFQHRRLPGYFSEDEIRRRDSTFRRLADESTHVVVSSEDARRDLLEFFPVPAGRVSSLPFATVAVPEWYAGSPDEVIEMMGVPQKFIIYPSQFWMHKNHRCLLDALRIASARHPDIALVCTGHMSDYRNPDFGDGLLAEISADVVLRDRVHCLGLLERTTQVQLIRGAAAVVQPSFCEGWSSLVEDAQAFGKRIYVSDIPIHREQNPPDARFFDPESPEELAALLSADWDSLSAGPDLKKETEARCRQEGRAADYARRFMSILEKVDHP